ncbi:hypothetical protein QQF21_06740 [Lelliottia sp. V89_10]|uniref:hypothetical protein n=1 Tax=Lelliottia wanjuensis TaxID=3050585 RepID=UPI00249EFD16|nr:MULTISPECIES: hypothetical protein [unclassified Lelliottia]MDI3361617.1 hypothetical protein [Lelliottia sp. V89_13]MDK9550098.1 hypothetical protein [Lelliottia sp. V89_5]MDK9595309.1 hypothetical protein [Lelliottia sp. V89_10]
MTSKLFVYIILIVCCFYSRLSFSGDPGGLFLFVTQIETTANEKNYIDNFFKKHYSLSREDAPVCEIQGATGMQKDRPQVDVYYLNSKIQGVDSDLLEKSIESNKSRAKLRKFLVGFNDKRVHGGFDAILFYKLKGDVVYFYGLSAIYKPEPLKKSSIAVSALSDEAKLGHAICLALEGLPTPAP